MLEKFNELSTYRQKEKKDKRKKLIYCFLKSFAKLNMPTKMIFVCLNNIENIKTVHAI